MSKRALSSTPSSPRKRRNDGRPANDQSSLDSFFKVRTVVASISDTPTVSSSSRDRSGKTKAKAQQVPVEKASKDATQSLANDEAFARKLAEEDGIDLHMLRNLEQRIGSSSAAISRNPGTEPDEGIDVDLLDNSQEQCNVPSSISMTKPCGSPGRTRTSATFTVSPSPTKLSATQLGSADSTTSIQFLPLDVDPLLLSLDICPWPANNTPAPYSFLAHILSTLSGTRSRISILNTLTNGLRTVIKYHPASLCSALYLLSNSLSPPYLPLELGLGPSIISKAIQDVSGLTPAALKRLYNTTGDPGDVAFEAKSNIRTLVPHPPLGMIGVYESLLKIARAKGAGAGKKKQGVVEKLLVAAKGEETRYLVRTLCQNLRVGAVRTSILTALSRALVLTPPAGMTNPFLPDSDFYASSTLLADVKPLLSSSKKKQVDKSRDELNEKFSRAEAVVKKAYVVHPNYDHIAAAVLEVGLEGLSSRLPLTVGIPLLPTLGSPTRSLDEVYDRLGSQSFSAEFKYDGQRAQVHGSRTPNGLIVVKIFSRHLEDMTEKYPDVVALVQQLFANSEMLQSFILDSEIVAIDPADGSLRSFQELSNRARRDVNVTDIKVPVCVFAFDLMYLNEEILLEKSFRRRRSLLRTTFSPFIAEEAHVARFDHVQSCESEDGRDIVEEFWQNAVNGRSEGLMIKLLDSGEVIEEVGKEGRSRRKPLPATYEPDKRTSAWLKLKKDYVTGLGDSLDLVPIGAWHGNGRKAQWWSPILLAVWDPVAGRLVAVCKCMSGFSDAFYKDLRERYAEDSDTCKKAPVWDPPVEVGGLRPEVYFKPQEVWEIRGADVTISPVSVAALGIVADTRGLSLRFPRFMKIREDKSIEHASTPEFLAGMYRSQQAQGNGRGGVDDGDLVDIDIEESEVEEFESEEDG